MVMTKRAVALGFFDGVHIGHGALLRRLIDVCGETGLAPTVITFDVLPQNLINGCGEKEYGGEKTAECGEKHAEKDKKTIPLINSPEDRKGLIERIFGISEVIFLPFDKAMSAMTWDKFVDLLIADYGVQHIVAGNNFRFGSGATGDCELLRKKCSENGIGCDIIPDVQCKGIVVSSTYIRELLQGAQIERANEFLGHPHVLTDIVHSGQKLGRTLGAPTLNMRFPPDVLIPTFGVYATKVYCKDGIEHIGVTNIGIRPTVSNGQGEQNVTAETYVTEYKGNLYGEQVRVELHCYLRPEKKFDSVEELKTQIIRDRTAAVEYFESGKTALSSRKL